jgi:exopolyphosphatase / guanosine-5'-triphosphate,3'-diphosphate pyrophosphatase
VLCACIDIGSNTTRLLVADVADGSLREVMQQRAYTRLRGRSPVPPDRLAAIAEAVATQVRLARECGCAHLRVVGTAALRDTPNRDELVAAIEEAAGVGVDVLSGEDEAKLAFAGATRTLAHLPLGEVGVVDVGGGSTELVTGTLADGVSWSASFRIGSGFLAESYLRSDPPSAAELQKVRHHVAGVFEGLDAPRPPVAYAVGGSAGSLRRLVGSVLDPDSLERGLRVLSATPAADVARRFELDPERVKLLPAGMLILEEASRLLGAPLRIGRGGLREGVVLSEIARSDAGRAA